ncbi:MAG: hypothetical protein AAF560_21430 [Acidobacteriota bacterium]
MSRDDHDMTTEPEDWLVRELAEASAWPEAAEPDLDSDELARYVDGVLSKPARRDVEAHLASSAEDRQIAMAAALAQANAVTETESAPAEATGEVAAFPVPSARPSWRQMVALAAVLLIAVAGVFWWSTQPPSASARLAALGVSEAAFDAAGPELVANTVAALEGSWPRLAGFEPFLADQGPILRGASALTAPLPLAPRWSVVADDRPTWVWRLEANATDVEIMVVDDSEELIVASKVAEPVAAGDGTFAVRLPQAAVALQPGRAYAWKVNARIGGEWVASPYVPFRRASAGEQEQLEETLNRSAGNPLLRTVALGSAGCVGPALEAAKELDPTVGRQLAAGLLGTQHLTPAELERELERWSGADLESGEEP